MLAETQPNTDLQPPQEANLDLKRQCLHLRAPWPTAKNTTPGPLQFSHSPARPVEPFHFVSRQNIGTTKGLKYPEFMGSRHGV